MTESPAATLIMGGEVFSPSSMGKRSILVLGERIAAMGDVDRRAAEILWPDLEVVDASGCIVSPGLVDPHEHLIGGSGERGGFSTMTPEISLAELALAGVTTTVGTLGTDTTARTMPALLAKVKALREEGLSAFAWSGGYHLPGATVTGSLRSDVMLVEEIIGAGEIAISDRRSRGPSADELAAIVADAYAGGLLSNKAGLTHFHVGAGSGLLAPLRDLLNDPRYAIHPESLYPTHVERNEPLFLEAVELCKRGSPIDVDVIEQDLHGWLRLFLDAGGEPSRLTISSDAAVTGPGHILSQIRDAVLERGFALELVLRLATENPARILKLRRKGSLASGLDADILVLKKDGLELRDVFSRGRRLVKDSVLAFKERWREGSARGEEGFTFE